MILYDYYRSSASYRVRIALNLKLINYESRSVNLLKAEQLSEAHQALNPQQLVPVLVDNGDKYTQSLAICEYLDEAYPSTYPLLVGDAPLRCSIRAFSQAIACEVHPINNLRILKYLETALDHGEAVKKQWYQHWVNKTFSALELQLEQRSIQHPFCFAKQPTLADVCLIPQIYNARRFDINMQTYPKLLEIEHQCQQLEAFNQAHPENQVSGE